MTASECTMVCGWCEGRDSSVVYDFGAQKIRRCHGCGLMQTFPKPSADQLKSIYTEDYYQNPGLLDPRGQKIYGYTDYIAERLTKQMDYRTTLRHIQKHLDAAGVASRRLCDVGCGLGFFLDSAFDLGFEPRGLEFNDAAVRYARQRYAFPVTTYDGSLLSVLSPSSMAVVTSFDTIEHLTRPFDFLREAHDVLVPGGILVLSTMDASSFVSRLLGKRLEDFRRILEHLYFFDRERLVKILEASGFEVQDLRSIGHTFELGHLAARIGASFPWFSGISTLVQRSSLRKMTVSINPRTKMVVYARKPLDGSSSAAPNG
jgi:2-polyprenyl-3-methyl-5-hydroxy-6-metoxy-1,4-benzoquinol methylase